MYQSLVAHKEITPRKGFGTDVAHKSTEIRSGQVRLEEDCEEVMLTVFLWYVYGYGAANARVGQKGVGNVYFQGQKPLRCQ